MKTFFSIIFLTLSSLTVAAQDSNFQKGEVWLGSTFGFTFQDQEIARLNEEIYLGQPELESQLAFQFIPKIEYAVFNKFLVGTHLGFSMNIAESDHSSNLNLQNYKAGIHARYYIVQLLPKLFVQSEIGFNYNYLQADENHNSYFKSYLDAGISFNISQYWLASLTFKDILTYHSEEPNFDNRSDFSNNNFSDFINFPHFSIMFRFN